MTPHSPAGRRLAILAALLLLILVGWRSRAQVPRMPAPLRPLKPRPDLRDIRYGPHERNVLDIWKARPKPGQSGPTPLVVFFHGGAFRMGDKSSVPAWLVIRCLDAGISVASAGYRLSQDAPFPAPMRDGARAVQFLRARAGEFGIDPGKIAGSGSSAGAGIALWVGFHDDLADPASPDPVARQSTRLACLGVDSAQTSYDPRFIRTIIGGRAHEHFALKPFFGLSDKEIGTARAYKLFEDASPINYATAGDPPVILFYTEPDEPLPPDARAGQGIHHPRFGAALKAKLDPLAVECIVRHTREFPAQFDPDEAMYREMVAFFARRLGE